GGLFEAFFDGAAVLAKSKLAVYAPLAAAASAVAALTSLRRRFTGNCDFLLLLNKLGEDHDLRARHQKEAAELKEAAETQKKAAAALKNRLDRTVKRLEGIENSRLVSTVNGVRRLKGALVKLLRGGPAEPVEKPEAVAEGAKKPTAKTRAAS
ncbi:MAG: hypothetical protein ACRDD1_16235, partial [Planctomycetia bacterium]